MFVAGDNIVVKWLGNGRNPSVKVAIEEGLGIFLYQTVLQINGVAQGGAEKWIRGMTRPYCQGLFEMHWVEGQIGRMNGNILVVMVKRRAVEERMVAVFRLKQKLTRALR